MSKKFGLLGKSLGHSVSPLLHQYLGDYSYELIERDEEGARALWEKSEYNGFNVTIPYKKLAYSLCNELSPEARAIGSVNTVIFKQNGRSVGFNTDAFGFDYLLRRNGIDVCGRDCLILGTGGASLAIEYVLGLHNAKSISFLTRSKETCSLLKEPGIEGHECLKRNIIEYKEVYDKSKDSIIKDYQILINTTPVGMTSDNPELAGQPVDLGLFDGLEAVIDIIYNPIQTNLCKQAKEQGIKWCGGLQMLIAQGYKAAEIFKGRQ